MSSGPLRVVIVEDSPADVELISAALRRDGLATTTVPVDSYDELAAALAVAPDVVLADHNVPGMSIAQVIRTVRSSGPGVPVIVVTGALDDDTAMALFEQGVSDVLLKDRLARLGPAVRTAVGTRQLEQAVVLSRAERAEIEGMLACLVQNSPSAIGLLDPAGREIFSNARFRALAGDRDRRTQLVAMESGSEYLDGDEVFLVTRFAVRGGTDTDTETESAPSLGVILTDITDQKAVQAGLRATQGELRRHNDELQELDRLKSELVNTVSHELRTPLTSIVGYGELMEDHLRDRDDAPGLRLMATLQRNATRLLGLVDNLLQLAVVERADVPQGRAAQRAGTGSRVDIDLNQLLVEACSVLVPAAQRRGLTMERHLATDLPLVAGDPGQLERVLLNVGSNAVKFAAERGRVVWRTRHAGGDAVEVEVEDDGAGIASEDLGRLGHRFFRTDSARTNHVPGTGLGLAVVRAAVANHGGEVSFASQPGKGTRVTVRLPARAARTPSAQ